MLFLHGQIPGLETALEPIIRGFIATVCMVGLMELPVAGHLPLTECGLYNVDVDGGE
ncbi:MAG: hypothetical protein ACLU80_11185 [Dorea sp.]